MHLGGGGVMMAEHARPIGSAPADRPRRAPMIGPYSLSIKSFTSASGAAIVPANHNGRAVSPLVCASYIVAQSVSLGLGNGFSWSSHPFSGAVIGAIDAGHWTTAFPSVGGGCFGLCLRAYRSECDGGGVFEIFHAHGGVLAVVLRWVDGHTLT
jgi:hypothetical protein